MNHRRGSAVLLTVVLLVAASAGSASAATTVTTRASAAASASVKASSIKWQEITTPPSCRCSDGSPYHYWVRRGNPKKVLFFLEGGGACFSAETCSGARPTFTVNLAKDKAPARAGIFDFANPKNPFADYSVVFAPYCTGDLDLGTTAHDYGSGVVIQHVGYDNTSTALGGAAALFPQATKVVVAGSSAGSAGAPGFGGGAHDVWPKADVSVVADSSAAYPGTPEITLAIGSLWGISGGIPLWPETKDVPVSGWSLPGLFVNASKHDPKLRFATYNSAYDRTQSEFSRLIGIDPTNLVDLIDANNNDIRSQGVDIANWVQPGTVHTILGKRLLYTAKVGKERFIDWLTKFVAGRHVADVHCTDCKKPT
jgi:hypothetical protein